MASPMSKLPAAIPVLISAPLPASHSLLEPALALRDHRRLGFEEEGHVHLRRHRRSGGPGEDVGDDDATRAQRGVSQERPSAQRHRGAPFSWLTSDGGGWITDSPRLRLRLALRPRDVLRLALPGFQTRLAARFAEPPRPPLGSHCHSSLDPPSAPPAARSPGAADQGATRAGRAARCPTNTYSDRKKRPASRIIQPSPVCRPLVKAR